MRQTALKGGFKIRLDNQTVHLEKRYQENIKLEDHT